MQDPVAAAAAAAAAAMADMEAGSPPEDFQNPVLAPAHVEGPPNDPQQGVLNAARNELLAQRVLVSEVTGARWELLNVVQECIFGVVVRAAKFVVVQGQQGFPERRYDAQLCAVKMVLWERIQQRGLNSMENPLREVAAMQHLARDGAHPNIMGAYEVLKDNFAIYVVMPFWSGGDLLEFLMAKPDGPLTEAQAKPLFRQLVDALAHIHSDRNRVVHRDISGENSMLSEDRSRLVVMDFGGAMRYPAGPRGTPLRRQGAFGKRFFMSPEVLANGGPLLPEAVDVWAAGVCLHMCLLQRYPFTWAHPSCGQFQQVAMRHELAEALRASGFAHLSQQAVDIMQGCLKRHPAERYTVEQLRNHPWLR